MCVCVCVCMCVWDVCAGEVRYVHVWCGGVYSIASLGSGFQTFRQLIKSCRTIIISFDFILTIKGNRIFIICINSFRLIILLRN